MLVVEDDRAIGTNLQRALVNAGHDCELADTAAAARTTAIAPDLVLLDLGLPDADGLDLIRELHQRWPDVPVIMLTARSEEIDIVVGLDAGAVDYVTKPFRLAELLARVRAQLREPPAGRVVEQGGLRVDLDARRVWRADTEIELRAQEFDLLAVLVLNAGRAVSREQLMRDAWDEHWYGSTKTLDVHIAALRRKLDPPDEPSVISTIRRFGYRLEDPG